MTDLAKFSAVGALVAMAVSPVHAAELPRVGAPTLQVHYATQTILNDRADEAEHRRRYRYRRHHDRTDAGDVIAGALIIGGIFAVLAASNNSSQDRGDRYDDDSISNNAFDDAVDSCVDRIEREQRIGSVDNVGRTRTGYSISGMLASGTSFHCEVTATGRVTAIDYGRSEVTYRSGSRGFGGSQYPDEVYARARSNTYATPDSNAQPAYPGGPLPGEEDDPTGGYSDDAYGYDAYGADAYSDDAYGADDNEDYPESAPYR